MPKHTIAPGETNFLLYSSSDVLVEVQNNGSAAVQIEFRALAYKENITTTLGPGSGVILNVLFVKASNPGSAPADLAVKLASDD